MKKYLTQEQVRFLFDYDPNTGIFWHRGTKRADYIGRRAGKISSDGYWRLRVDERCYNASHIAWLYMTARMPTKEIDHINGVRCDDRFCNLREATRSQNCHGKIKFCRPNKYGFRGVKGNHRRFQSVICVKQQHIYLGTFDTPEQAAKAYDIAAKRYFGSFAQLNFPSVVRRDWLIV